MVEQAAGAVVLGGVHRRVIIKIRDGQVGYRPVYAAIGVDLDGHKDILGMWAGDGVLGRDVQDLRPIYTAVTAAAAAALDTFDDA